MINPCKLDDSAVIPVSDGIFETDNIPMLNRSWISSVGHSFRIAFYSDAEGKEIVTPTAGTATPMMEAIPGQWHEPSDGDLVIDAALCGKLATYEIPLFPAPARKGRVELSGIEGAAYFRAHFVGG